MKRKYSKIHIARYFYIHEAFNIVLFMLDLEHCVENALCSIVQNVFKIDEKFKQFVTIICQNCINNKRVKKTA